MALHFSVSEFEVRISCAVAEMKARRMDGLLIFRQESMYYLTGYDTFGFVFFQCLYLGADGRLLLLTRAPDRLQAKHTSTITDVRIWVDGAAAHPALQLREILETMGCQGARLGVEWDAYGLTARNGRELAVAFEGFAALEDASEVVSRLRLVKSPRELDYVRRAAALADDAYSEAARLARPGEDEGRILSAMQAAIITGGGDDPANPFVIGSGEDALLCRYKTGRRRLSDVDLLTLEWAGVYRHYHACLMRTLAIGRADPRHVRMHAVAIEALSAAEAALVPGRPLRDVFLAYAGCVDAAGYGGQRLNASGYSLGATFAPNWMDWPMIHAGSDIPVEAGMVFFIPIVIADAESGLAVTLGRTSEVTAQGARALSQAPLDLAVA